MNLGTVRVEKIYYYATCRVWMVSSHNCGLQFWYSFVRSTACFSCSLTFYTFAHYLSFKYLTSILFLSSLSFIFLLFCVENIASLHSLPHLC